MTYHACYLQLISTYLTEQQENAMTHNHTLLIVIWYVDQIRLWTRKGSEWSRLLYQGVWISKCEGWALKKLMRRHVISGVGVSPWSDVIYLFSHRRAPYVTSRSANSEILLEPQIDQRMFIRAGPSFTRVADGIRHFHLLTYHNVAILNEVQECSMVCRTSYLIQRA